jgi:hypothetical protein
MIFICDVDDGLLNAVDPIILLEFCPEESVINMTMIMISMKTMIIMIMMIMMMLIIMISINIITYLVFTMNDLAGDSTRKE